MKYYFFILICFLSVVSCKQESSVNNKVIGNVFGTTYSVIYNSDAKVDFESQFDSIFYLIKSSYTRCDTII